MPFFRPVPYRWTWRTAWRNIVHHPEDIYYGIRNLIRWAPVIWFDVDWDHSALLNILIYKFDGMAEAMENGPTTDGARCAKQLRECRDLARRLKNDDYFTNAGLGYSEVGPNPNYYIRGRGYEEAIHATQMQKQDKQRLGYLIGKYLDHWWN